MRPLTVDAASRSDEPNVASEARISPQAASAADAALVMAPGQPRVAAVHDGGVGVKDSVGLGCGHDWLPVAMNLRACHVAYSGRGKRMLSTMGDNKSKKSCARQSRPGDLCFESKSTAEG